MSHLGKPKFNTPRPIPNFNVGYGKGCRIIETSKQCGKEGHSLFRWKTRNGLLDKSVVCQEHEKQLRNSLEFLGWAYTVTEIKNAKEKVTFT